VSTLTKTILTSISWNNQTFLSRNILATKCNCELPPNASSRWETSRNKGTKSEVGAVTEIVSIAPHW